MNIDTSLEANKAVMQTQLGMPTNSDVILRAFTIDAKGAATPAFCVCVDGLVNTQLIDEDILAPLATGEVALDSLPHTQVKELQTIEDCVNDVLNGNLVLFVDGLSNAITCDVKNFAGRSVSTPQTEKIISGSQEAFVEGIRTNTSLVRKIIRQRELICEAHKVGTLSKTNVALMYIDNIVGDGIVFELRRRLSGVNVDYLIDSGELEQLIEDFTFLPAPQIYKTERPDRVATALTQGKAVLIVDGSPFALILPTNFADLLASTEDKQQRMLFANLVRCVRTTALVLSLILPAFIVALINFHYNAIPTGLLFAILKSREHMPFSLVFELIILELFFELIREAGLRVPSPIGATIGIIGALIIGQSAVEANIVSPFLIIIVAITGVASYTIPSYALAFSFRIMKYVYIAFAAMAGFLGLSFVLFLHILLLSDAQSLGIPFLAPFAPKLSERISGIFVKPIGNRETRAPFLKPKRRRQQGDPARGWAQGHHAEEDDLL